MYEFNDLSRLILAIRAAFPQFSPVGTVGVGHRAALSPSLRPPVLAQYKGKGGKLCRQS